MPLLLETSGYPTAHVGGAFSCGCWAWWWGAFSWGKHRQEVSPCTVSVIIWASETQPPSQEQEASWQDKLQAHVRVGGVEGRYQTMSHVRRVGGCQRVGGDPVSHIPITRPINEDFLGMTARRPTPAGAGTVLGGRHGGVSGSPEGREVGG